MALFNPNYHFEDPPSKYSHILKHQVLGHQHTNLGRTVQPLTEPTPEAGP